ncbi:Mu transposase domain-containing protein [Streptomyces yanii]|uniref:Transposase for insertion sequence element IS21-like C-terminal domain-containing protein n=1 Tax=Streptomyces yanii TaxID=78510 RepID=A0ABV5R227_9ACTN
MSLLAAVPFVAAAAKGVIKPWLAVVYGRRRGRHPCVLHCHLRRFSQISVRTNRYSVPVRLIGQTMRALLHSSELVVYDGQQEVARHERLIVKGQARLDLDHYLEALVRKPGAAEGTGSRVRCLSIAAVAR